MIERTLRIAAIAAAAVTVLTTACRPAPMVVDVDLAEAWPQALVATEAAVIDLGTPEARRHLGAGWYHDERNRSSGDTFVWSRGGLSELVFHLGWTRDLEVEILCRPFQFSGAPPQLLTLELNGRPVAELELRPEIHTYRILLPAGDQVAGANRLVAGYGRVDSPALVTPGATDERELAVAWSSLRFDRVDQTPVVSSSGLVRLPVGSWSDHFFETAAGSWLEIERCNPGSDDGPALEVAVLPEGANHETTRRWTCSGGPYRFGLGQSTTLKRIRLSVVPNGETEAPAGVELVRPAILAPTSPSRPRLVPVPTPDPVENRPNLVIYLVDALRADRLGVYGCDRPLSPRLDAMAAEGIVFTDVIAQSSWTKAAVASIFTGIWPRAHGVNGPDDRLPDGLPTLPEIARAAGYRTGAVVANAYVGRPFGFARGFDHFEFVEHTAGRSEVLHDRVTRWLRSGEGDERPFLLYVHAIDPHAPYAPPVPYRERFAGSVTDPSVGEVETVRGLVLGTVEPTAALGRDLEALYDGEVAANDASFGKLLDELVALGELDDTVVVFTSDHGEAFGEHGTWTHGLDLTNEVLAIPLVVRLPDAAGAGQRVQTTVQHIDLLPTLLALAGIECSTELPGAVMLGADGSVRVGEGRTVLAYLDYWDRHGAAALRDGWKLVEPLSAEFGSEPELFFRPRDPHERRNLAHKAPVRRGWLEARLDWELRTRGVSERTDVDFETREHLEALGYIE